MEDWDGGIECYILYMYRRRLFGWALKGWEDRSIIYMWLKRREGWIDYLGGNRTIIWIGPKKRGFECCEDDQD